MVCDVAGGVTVDTDHTVDESQKTVKDSQRHSHMSLPLASIIWATFFFQLGLAPTKGLLFLPALGYSCR